MNLTEELLDRHIREGRAQCTAIYFEDERISYGEIASRVNSLGNSLLRIGITTRDRVGIRLTNIPQAIIANFALLKIGAIPVPISPLWSRSEIVYVGEDAQLKAIVVSRSLLNEVSAVRNALPLLNAVIVVNDTRDEKLTKERGYYAFEDLVHQGTDILEPARLQRDDVAILLYTSGTTGLPKGCAHTAAGVLIVSSLITKYVWDLTEKDVLAGSAPISLAAGFGTFALIPWTSRAAISLLPKFSPELLMSNIVLHRATVLTGIPTAYRKLLAMDDFGSYSLSGLRLCTSGGDALGANTFDSWLARTGLPIWENLGTTEFYNIMVSNRMGSCPKRNSIGLPLPGFEVRLLDEQGVPCPVGEAGSMYVRGPTGIIYWNLRGRGGQLMNAQMMSVKDGWSKLGDAAYRDEEGYLFFVAREDDMIKSAGYRMSPLEIEGVLLQHALVREAAVVGLPDPVLGLTITACLVLREQVPLLPGLEEELKEHCRRRIAIYKIPRKFQAVTHLPRTPTGKVLRNQLLDMLCKNVAFPPEEG